MRRQTRVVLCLAGLLGVAAAATAAYFLMIGSAQAADRLVGSWEGEGTGRSNMSMNFAENRGTGSLGKFDAMVTLRTSIRATFNRDGTMTMSWRSEGDGIRFSFEVPDPKKPGDVGRWTAVRTDGDAVVVRMINPDQPEAPEWRVVFNGGDEFTATPVDPSKGTDPIVFRRVGR
jgi:hypothetical protein